MYRRYSLKYTCVWMIRPFHPSESSIVRYTDLSDNVSQMFVTQMNVSAYRMKMTTVLRESPTTIMRSVP